MAREMSLDNVGRSRKQEVIAAIVRKQSKRRGHLRRGTRNPSGRLAFARGRLYLAGPDDIYVLKPSASI